MKAHLIANTARSSVLKRLFCGRENINDIDRHPYSDLTAQAGYEVLRAPGREAECGLFPIRISSLCLERKFSILWLDPRQIGIRV